MYFTLSVTRTLTYTPPKMNTTTQLIFTFKHTPAQPINAQTKLELVTPDRTFMLYCDSPAIAEQWGVSLKGARATVGRGEFEGMDRMLEFVRNAGTRLSLGSSLRHVGLRARQSSRSSLTGPPADDQSAKYSTVVLAGWMTKRGIRVSERERERVCVCVCVFISLLRNRKIEAHGNCLFCTYMYVCMYVSMYVW